MTLFVIIFIIFILHISFLIQMLVTGENIFDFFGWIAVYPYNREIVLESLIFVSFCMLFFILGYLLIRKSSKSIAIFRSNVKRKTIYRIKIIYNFFICIIILVSLYIIIKGNASYAEMTVIRENMSFLFELRIVPILGFIYMLQFITKSNINEFRIQIFLFILLLILFLVIQARSLFFELGCVLGYFLLKKIKNKVKLKYVVCLYFLSIIPNIIVLGRLSPEQKDYNSMQTWKYIFTYEYTMLCNNILSEVIFQDKPSLHGETISNGFKLIVPSILRTPLDIVPDETKIRDIAEDANVYGGGFSQLAEMYINFRWLSPIFYLMGGLFFGYMDNKWFNKKSLNVVNCCTPLIYAYFILSMRNDMAVLLKLTVQVLIVAYTLQFSINKSFSFRKNVQDIKY